MCGGLPTSRGCGPEDPLRPGQRNGHAVEVVGNVGYLRGVNAVVEGLEFLAVAHGVPHVEVCVLEVVEVIPRLLTKRGT